MLEAFNIHLSTIENENKNIYKKRFPRRNLRGIPTEDNNKPIYEGANLS